MAREGVRPVQTCLYVTLASEAGTYGMTDHMKTSELDQPGSAILEVPRRDDLRSGARTASTPCASPIFVRRR
jgi:hypothetical protein